METWEVTFEDKNPQQSTSPNGGARNSNRNVSTPERIASAIGGGALLGFALKNRSKSSIVMGLAGACLLYRGATGQCETYRLLGVNTAGAGAKEEVARDVHVEKSITIITSPTELYRFWRNFENLPRFMENLESVSPLDDVRSHWVAIGPGGKKIEWDAEIYNEKEGELIAWRSLSGSDITNAGSVHFEEAPGGRGTYVKVVLNYNPPGGRSGALFAKLVGREPGQLVEHNLKRLKQFIETGEISTTEGQPAGRIKKATGAEERKANRLATKTPAIKLPLAASEEVA